MSTKTKDSKSRKSLVADIKGAALAEFAVAFGVLIWLFFGLMQVAQIFIAHLVFHHAAVVAARCAAVEFGDNLPGSYVASDPTSHCRDAGIAALGYGIWRKTVFNLQVAPTYQGGNDHLKQYDPVTTVVTADYECHVPLGKKLICSGGDKHWSISVMMPHEGAMYTLDDDFNGS